MSKNEHKEETDAPGAACEPGRRLLALDLGSKRVGLAVSDEGWLAVRPLKAIERRSWKELLRQVSLIAGSFDAQALILGLPLMMDGTEGPAAAEARRLARNFQLSLHLPVFLQDERLTSREAETNLRAAGHTEETLRDEVDSQAAAIILNDFIASRLD